MPKKDGYGRTFIQFATSLQKNAKMGIWGQYGF